ncbi:hypothetical protein [Tepidibacter hydrothermalis]|uniref:Uncharacterized protein n=1 Tax=Tepidibacter hydrothermalis TaxID=3036126 RepID=A0ABY8E7A5_9FIRM|nr:hypothetical protein [Tepidibacter hydrothermalis]WFD08781.1 hypothetical protein P4S50_10260 [Tepidibacter hydrothermalis]
MMEIDTTVDFLLFNGISNILNRSIDVNGEDIANLEGLVDYYVKNHGQQTYCLLRKLSMLKNKIE